MEVAGALFGSLWCSRKKRLGPLRVQLVLIASVADARRCAPIARVERYVADRLPRQWGSMATTDGLIGGVSMRHGNKCADCRSPWPSMV